VQLWLCQPNSTTDIDTSHPNPKPTTNTQPPKPKTSHHQLIAIGIVIYQLITEPDPDAKHDLIVKPGAESGTSLEAQLVAFFNIIFAYGGQFAFVELMTSMVRPFCVAAGWFGRVDRSVVVRSDRDCCSLNLQVHSAPPATSTRPPLQNIRSTSRPPTPQKRCGPAASPWRSPSAPP